MKSILLTYLVLLGIVYYSFWNGICVARNLESDSIERA